MSNPYRDLGLPPPREPMFLEVALKKAKEKHVTQLEIADKAIARSELRSSHKMHIPNDVLKTYIRVLAKRLDACLVEAERVGGQAEREIRAILNDGDES